MQTAVNVLASPIVDNQRGTIIDRLNPAGLPAISQSPRAQRQAASPHTAVTDRLYPSCGTHYRSHHPRHSTDGDSGQAADQIRVGVNLKNTKAITFAVPQAILARVKLID